MRTTEPGSLGAELETTRGENDPLDHELFLTRQAFQSAAERPLDVVDVLAFRPTPEAKNFDRVPIEA